MGGLWGYGSAGVTGTTDAPPSPVDTMNVRQLVKRTHFTFCSVVHTMLLYLVWTADDDNDDTWKTVS